MSPLELTVRQAAAQVRVGLEQLLPALVVDVTRAVPEVVSVPAAELVACVEALAEAVLDCVGVDAGPAAHVEAARRLTARDDVPADAASRTVQLVAHTTMREVTRVATEVGVDVHTVLAAREASWQLATEATRQLEEHASGG